MTVSWTLELDGETKTLAEWKLLDVALSILNLGRDTLAAVRSGNFDAEPLCAYGTAAKLYRDGVKWFEGQSMATPRFARSNGERQEYLFVGPWHFLERNLMQAPWYRASNGLTIRTPHLIFPVASVATHITNILTYAISVGANLQVGTITAPVQPPAFEVAGLTCAGAIQRLLRYAPDTCGWFDYSTSPPTFHLKPHSALTAVDLAMPSSGSFGARMETIQPMAREDLQVDNVRLIYEIANQEDGRDVLAFTEDVYPPGTTGSEDGCLSEIINLQGYSATTVNGYIVAEEIDTSSLTWWKLACPELNDPLITSIQLIGTPTRAAYDGGTLLNLPRRLIDGQAASWMKNPDGNPVQWQKERISATFRVTKQKYQGGQLTPDVVLEFPHAEVTTTNAPVGETHYSQLATMETGDSVPVGLAQYLYDSLHVLHYDAGITLHKEDCDDTVQVRNLVNITGGHTDWQTMRAMVQNVTHHIDQGITQISCGPPHHLSVDDILELLRVGRIRRRWTNPAVQADGILAANEVSLGKATANNNSSKSPPNYETFVVAKNAGSEASPDMHAVKIDISAAAALFANLPAGSRTLTIREVEVCVNGQTKRMLVIASEPYDP